VGINYRIRKIGIMSLETKINLFKTLVLPVGIMGGNTFFYIIDNFFYISELLLVQGLWVSRLCKRKYSLPQKKRPIMGCWTVVSAV
jgi:hypothetical protein